MHAVETPAGQELAPALKKTITDLPCACADLPGIGGLLKALPEHFQVEEILPYAACGQGEHVFVTLRRSGWNTVDVARALADCFSLQTSDVGWAGRKDKQAVTTQTFSLRLPLQVTEAQVAAALRALPFEILAIARHRNKLKLGHVAGNRFRIVLSEVSQDALQPALAIADLLAARGIPNYFGEQRFGIGMSNLDRAAALLSSAKPPRGTSAELMVSALQAGLFNAWLRARMERGDFDRMLEGDIAQKTDTGGLFVVEDLADAERRFQSGAIVYTGPVYGFKMKAAAGQSAVYENGLLEHFGLTAQNFKALRAPGSRRAALLRLRDLSLRTCSEGLMFSFTLPSGAYATTVLREFMRGPDK